MSKPYKKSLGPDVSIEQFNPHKCYLCYCIIPHTVADHERVLKTGWDLEEALARAAEKRATKGNPSPRKTKEELNKRTDRLRDIWRRELDRQDRIERASLIKHA